MWRCEFQQLESEYISKRPSAHPNDRTRPEPFKFPLQIGVARGQHRGEPRHFFFSPASFAWLLEVPVIAHFLKGAFAVDFLFQPAERLFNGLAFFKSDFGQL